MTVEPRREGTLVVRAGRIVYATEGFAALAGRPVAELVGRASLELLAPEDRPRLEAIRERRARGEAVPQSLEVALLAPGGARHPVEWHTDEDGPEQLVHVRDLAGEAPRRELLETLAELGATLRVERSEGGISSRLQRALGQLGVVSALLQVEGDRSRVVWVTAPEAVRRALEERTGARPEGFAGPVSAFARRVLEEGCAFSDDWAAHAAAFLAPDVAADARSIVQRAGFGRAIGVRIDAAAPHPGTYLVLASPHLRGGDVPAVRLFAAQVSAALDAARTIADLSRRNAHLAVLARVAELAGDTADLGAFFARASEVVRPVAGYAACGIYVPDAAAEDLVRIHVDAGVPASIEALSRRVGLDTPVGEALRSRAARVTSVPFPGGSAALVAALPYRSIAWVPLVARSRGVGVLVAAFDGPADAAQPSLELLSSVAAHFAGAVESHGLLADLRRRVDELTLLVDVARASAQLDPVLLLEAALRRVCATVGADAGAAWLREENRLVLLSSVGVDAECAAHLAELAAGEGAPGLAVERRGPVRVATAEAFGPARPPPAACAALGPAIAVPLLAKAEAVGALLLARSGTAPFTDGDAALLSSIGSQLGLAVDAARLFGDVRRRLSDLEAVHALTLRVFANAPGDAGTLLRDACRELVRALSAQAAAVYLPSDGGAVMRPAGGVGLTPALESIAIDLRRDGVTAEVLRTRVPLQSEDITREPRSQLSGRTDLPAFSVLVVPLVSREDTRGVVIVADRAGRRFSPGEVAFANALAGALGLGVENAELYADARRRVEELSALNEAGRGIAASLDLPDVLREAAEAARRLVAASRAWVLLRDPGTGKLRVAGGVGIDPAVVGVEVAVEPGSFVETLVRDRRPAAAEDVQRSAVGAQYRELLGGRALAAVPVELRGELLGVLVADDVAGPRRFSGSDLERLTALADRLAIAIENARLYLETRRRAEQLGLLHEVGRSLVESLDIEQVLVAGVRNLARIVDAPDAYLWLVSQDGSSLELRAATPGGEGLRGARLPVLPSEDSLAARVVASREPLVLEDARADPRIHRRELAEAARARAHLVVPLVVRDRAIGAIVIVETRAPRLFTPAEVERAAAIANQLAVAADNARLYEDLRRSYAQLARAQQQLVQGERLAALGELSAVVAHEVRNPLGVIFNSLGSLRRLVRPAGDAKMLFDILEEESERLNRIVGDLLDFARPSTPELRHELLGRIAEDAVAAAILPLGDRIEVVRELDPDVPPVPVDARLVRQAVLNVAVNAAQAMPRGGRITVRARRDAAAVVLEIEDTGPGIPDEVRERIFEPFFTTKASGTGLGLAVVRRIVEGHGGEIRVRTAPGAGTTFALRFPLGALPVG